MKKHFIAGALILCAAARVFPDDAGAKYFFGDTPVSVDASGAAGFPGHLWSRLLAEMGDYRFVFMSRKDYERPEKDFAAAGFESPWLLAGPVTPGGLFRELFSPLGYTAGSSVFSETSRLLLYTKAEMPAREGVWLSVPGDYFALGAYSDGDDITHASAAFNLFRGKRGPLVSGLFMASAPESRLVSDAWFPERPLFPGGKVYHSALRGQIPFDALTDGITRAGFSGAFSFGERTVPAGYYHLFAAHTDKRVDIKLLYGAAEENYVTPAGKPPSSRVNRSAAARLFPRGPVIPYAAVTHTVYQVYEPAAAFRPERLRVSGGVEYRTKRLSLRAEGFRRTDKDESGRLSRTENMKTLFIYKTGWGSFSVEYASGWEDSVMARRRLSARGLYSPKGWEFSGRVKGEWRPSLEVSGKLSAAIDRPGLNLGLSAELVKPMLPRPSGMRAAGETPEQYFLIEVFFRYRMRF